MVDSGKVTDDLLDALSVLKRNRDSALAWLELYEEGGFLSTELAAHLREVLSGVIVGVEPAGGA